MYEHAVCSKEFQDVPRFKSGETHQTSGDRDTLLCLNSLNPVFSDVFGRYLGDLQRQGYL